MFVKKMIINAKILAYSAARKYTLIPRTPLILIDLPFKFKWLIIKNDWCELE